MENKKKKILYIITKSNWGGAGKNVFDLATHVSGEYDVVVAAGGKGALFEKLWEKNIRTISIDSLQRDVRLAKEISSFFTLYKIIRDEKPDIVHLHSPKAGMLGALAVFFLNLLKTENSKILTIYTSHGWAFNEERSSFQKILIKKISWLTIIFSHETIVLSEKEKRQVVYWPFVSKKVFIVPLGISPPDFLSKEEASKEIERSISASLPPHTYRVGTIAELHKNKGLEYAIRAISSMEKISYIIIGEGEERKKLETLISKLNLSSRVFLAGHIDNAARCLLAFDAFLLPSIKEGMPYVLLEAGYAGIPVISSRVGAVEEMIENLKEGLVVTAGQKQDIETALTFAVANPEKMLAMSSAFEKKTKEKYTTEKMVLNTLALYKD